MSDLKEILKIVKGLDKRVKNLESILTKKSTSVSEKKKSKSTPKSVTDFIKNFAEEGFFDTPKTLKEISEELARGGYHYKSSSLTNPLQRLLRKRSIGRIIVNGKWAYVKR